jgi:ribosomal protein S18 acetylase RimI-like enzyme
MPIREWQIKDIDQITNLLNELKDALNEKDLISIELVKKHYDNMRLCKLYKSFVFEEDNEIKGFISILFYESVFHEKGTALINELVVKTQNRNRGIGKQLLRKAIEEAEKSEMDEIEVGVLKENINAIKFYKNNEIDEEYILLGKEFC